MGYYPTRSTIEEHWIKLKKEESYEEMELKRIEITPELSNIIALNLDKVKEAYLLDKRVELDARNSKMLSDQTHNNKTMKYLAAFMSVCTFLNLVLFFYTTVFS